MTEQQEERLVLAVEKIAATLTRAEALLDLRLADEPAPVQAADAATQAIIEQNRMMIQSIFQGLLQWIQFQAARQQKEAAK